MTPEEQKLAETLDDAGARVLDYVGSTAEPKALIGFAGPRVIEQTIRQKLPKDFQRSEFLLDHGMIDEIVDRRELRDYITLLLNFMMNPEIHGESDIERARRAAKLKE